MADPLPPLASPPVMAPAPAPPPTMAASRPCWGSAVTSRPLASIGYSRPLTTRVSKATASRARPLTRPEGAAAGTLPRTSVPAGKRIFSVLDELGRDFVPGVAGSGGHRALKGEGKARALGDLRRLRLLEAQNERVGSSVPVRGTPDFISPAVPFPPSVGCFPSAPLGASGRRETPPRPPPPRLPSARSWGLPFGATPPQTHFMSADSPPSSGVRGITPEYPQTRRATRPPQRFGRATTFPLKGQAPADIVPVQIIVPVRVVTFPGRRTC
jgi:hypothetical protein